MINYSKVECDTMLKGKLRSLSDLVGEEIRLVPIRLNTNLRNTKGWRISCGPYMIEPEAHCSIVDALDRLLAKLLNKESGKGIIFLPLKNFFVGPILGNPEIPWLRSHFSLSDFSASSLLLDGYLYFETKVRASITITHVSGKEAALDLRTDRELTTEEYIQFRDSLHTLVPVGSQITIE